MKTLFIVNCWSGKGKGLIYKKTIEEWYEKRNEKPTIRLTEPSGANTVFNLGKSAALEGFEKVGLVGGDGTYQLAVSGMISSNVPLARLPLIGLVQGGTGNNFAKNLGLPKDIIEALEVIKYGQAVRVDLGKLILPNEEKYFLNVVSFGFDALIVEVSKRFKGRYPLLPKETHYLLAALGEIIRGMPCYQISIDKQEPKEMILCAVTNGPTYGAIFRIAPDADLRDGLLDVCRIDRVGKLKALKDIAKVLKGTHVKLPEVSMSRTASLTVSSFEPLPCEIDGEVLLPQKEYKIEVIPGGLKILMLPELLPAQNPLYIKALEPKFA